MTWSKFSAVRGLNGYHPFCLCRLAPPTRQARKLVRGMGMGAETLCHNPSRVFHPGLGIRPEYLVFEMG